MSEHAEHEAEHAALQNMSVVNDAAAQHRAEPAALQHMSVVDDAAFKEHAALRIPVVDDVLLAVERRANANARQALQQ